MAYEALEHDQDSRQVVLQIWDKDSDMPNPYARSKDVPCNLASHLMIRQGRLEWLQVMRSNDFYWGFPYNVIEFTTIQEIVSGWLGIDAGEYVHISDSLHVYKRHWKDLNRERPADSEIQRNKSDLRISSYDEWSRIIKRVVKYAQDLTEDRSAEDLASVIRESKDLPSAYREWIALLGAESLRRRNHFTEANKWIDDSGPFWSASWRQWAASKAARVPKHLSIVPMQT
jgi:thymidylate synthase